MLAPGSPGWLSINWMENKKMILQPTYQPYSLTIEVLEIFSFGWILLNDDQIKQTDILKIIIGFELVALMECFDSESDKLNYMRKIIAIIIGQWYCPGHWYAVYNIEMSASHKWPSSFPSINAIPACHTNKLYCIMK